MARYTDRKNEWLQIWEDDYRWLIQIAYQNLSDDLNAGYDPCGSSIQSQKEICREFEKQLSDGYEMFKNMAEEQIDHWCFYDLKKRGAID